MDPYGNSNGGVRPEENIFFLKIGQICYLYVLVSSFCVYYKALCIFQANVDQWFLEMSDKISKNSEMKPSGCREWLKGPYTNTYGKITGRMPLEKCKKTLYVHRIAYLVKERLVALPEGTEISHLCHNRRCVEPSHLRAEEHITNVERQHCKKQNSCTKNHTPHCIIQVYIMKIMC